MRKTIALFSIAFYLILALVLSHVHNHPIFDGENDSCPAYIIAISVSADQVPAMEADPTWLRVLLTITPLEEPSVSQNVCTSFRKRGPPFCC